MSKDVLLARHSSLASVPVESLLSALSALLVAELHSSIIQSVLLTDCNNLATVKVRQHNNAAEQSAQLSLRRCSHLCSHTLSCGGVLV